MCGRARGESKSSNGAEPDQTSGLRDAARWTGQKGNDDSRSTLSSSNEARGFADLRAWARFGAEDALPAGAAAAVISGVPSTILALRRGESPLEASLAAGSLLLPDEKRPSRLLAAAALVHATLSVGWALLLTIVLPRRATIRWSTIAGLAIATFDLGIVGRRSEPIRAVPMLPQVADHLTYGLTVGVVVAARRKRRTHSGRPT